MKTELVVALDFESVEAAEKLMQTLKGFPVIYKIGLELFSAGGPAWVKRCVDSGFRIFLDLKLHDIPNTVAQTLVQIERMGVEFTTIHLAGGKKMLEKIREKMTPKSPLKILGVSVLTSFSQEEWDDTLAVMVKEGSVKSIQETVLGFAGWVDENPLVRGMVCSSHEIASIRKKYPELYLMVPGIRIQKMDQDDQGRVMSPREAAQAGASAIVMGRPIIQALDPRFVVQEVLNQLS